MSDDQAKLVLMFIISLAVIVVTTVIAFDIKDRRYCKMHNGKWSRGVCFDNRMLVNTGE